MSSAQCEPPKGLADSTFILDLCPDTAVYDKSGNPASIGDTVYEWHSIDPNNWVFKNTRNDRRPVLDTNDGFRYLRFENGAFLSNTTIKDSINGKKEFSIYTVIRSDMTGTDQGIFYWKYPPDGQDDGLCLRYDDTGYNTGRNDVIKAGLNGNTAGNQVETTAGTQTTDRQVLAITWSSGGKLYSYVGGSPNDSSDNNVGGSMNSVDEIVIGKGAKDQNASEGWDGYIGRTIFYNDEHPPDTVQEISDALPIELLSFEAEPFENGVRLEWKTASEQNNDRFIIQRSTDGQDYQTIGTIDGAGTSVNPRSYAHTDKEPPLGIDYYRLKQIDFDGESTFYGPAVARFEGASDDLELYPNPLRSSEKMRLRWQQNNEEEILVVVRDIHGKKHYSKLIPTGQNGSTVEAIDLHSRLSPGVYFVIASSNDAMVRKKLVIEQH